MNLETKAESTAPENKSGAETLASATKPEPLTTKTDADNPVPAFKAPVSNILPLSFPLLCLKAIS